MTRSHNAQLVDQTAANISNDVAWAAVVAGLMPVPGATAVSAGLSVVGNLTGSENTALVMSQRQYDELLEHGASQRMIAMMALFGSGLVRTPSGKKVVLQVSVSRDGPTFRLVDDDDEPIPLGADGETVFRFDQRLEDYANHANFVGLTLNGAPINDYRARLEGIDTDIERAQRVANERFGDR